MIHDLIRTACVLVTMTVAASLAVETRFRFACIDAAHRQSATMQASTHPPPPALPPSQNGGRLMAVGKAILDLADAGLGVVR